MTRGVLWVISLIVIFFLSVPSFAEECRVVKPAEIVECDGTTYRLFDLAETKELLTVKSNYTLLLDKVSKLEQKIELKDQMILAKDERIQLLNDSLQMSNELVGKLFDSPYTKQKFFKKPAVNFAIGMFSTGVLFAFWEFSRSGLYKDNN